MNWILLLTILTTDGVSSQQIPMEETSCKHYEQQYNNGGGNMMPSDRGAQVVVYGAQCLNTGLPKKQ